MSTATSTTKYIETVGRRKEAIARVRIAPASKMSMLINGKEVNAYFPTDVLRTIAMQVVEKWKGAGTFKITAVINGGGINGHAEALRHALGRAYVEHDHSLRTAIKQAGYLKRDPRAKERRKFGHKKARKSPSWSKR